MEGQRVEPKPAGGGKGKKIAIAAGIVLGNIRRIHGKRIPYIRILMTVISVILPYARHRNLIESAGAEALLIKCFFQIVNTLIITEFPSAVQQYETVGRCPLLANRIHRRRCGNIIRTVRHRIQVKYAEILIISWYQHVFPLFLPVLRVIRYDSQNCSNSCSCVTVQPGLCSECTDLMKL